MIASAALLALLPLAANAHMMLSDPSVWGGRKADLENPLTGNNFFCHRESRNGNKNVMNIKAGSTLNLPITCGEAASNPDNAASICADDPNQFHNGGGCGLSIAYKTGAGINDFTMFSVAANCPDKGKRVNFQVPANLPACEECTCAWTWIPDPSASADEFYMNCFTCKIEGNQGTITGGTKLSDHLWAVNGVPARGERPLYKKVLPNGAQEVQVNGKASPDTPKTDAPKTETPKKDENTPTKPSSASPSKKTSHPDCSGITRRNVNKKCHIKA
ncbi:hypothetical protein DFS34DRAFT_628035 [Phlyctochytrium arcticum]|nr:hypothetical protein DFS34DRAFT_628035 [Phlyctochytrium arcticum]